MTRVLLVEDSATQAAMTRIHLQLAHFDAEIAENGIQALRALDAVLPEIVVTDLQMPEMDGVDLVEAIRGRHPSLPVVLTTTQGSEDLVLEALKKGALSYVPKVELKEMLGPTLRSVLAIARAEHDDGTFAQSLPRDDSGFRKTNDPSLVSALVAYCKHELTLRAFADPTGILQLAMALTEALEIAIHEGNLDISAELREHDPAACEQLAERRRHEPPYRDRQIHFAAAVSLAKAVFIVRHEGPGVLLARKPPLDLETVRERGAFLIHAFFDEVHTDSSGREVTLIKRREFG